MPWNLSGKTWEIDTKTEKKERGSSVAKNEVYRQMVSQCWKIFNFNYRVCDSWFSSAENMQMVKQGIGSQFIVTMKSKPKVAFGQTVDVKMEWLKQITNQNHFQ